MLAAERFTLVHAVDFALTMRKTVSDFFGKLVAITVCTDLKCLYDALTGINRTSEKLREISDFVWVSSKCNPVRAMTNDSPSPALRNWMHTNTLLIYA